MPFPKTIDEAREAGYVFVEHKKCSGRTCCATIEFWRTPRGKYMPFDVDEKGNLSPHWAKCPDSDFFRNGRMGR